MMKTGYQILDGSGINLSSLGKVDGFYKKAQEALKINKPCFLEGVTKSGETCVPIPVTLLSASQIQIYNAVQNIKVAENDTVSNLS